MQLRNPIAPLFLNNTIISPDEDKNIQSLVYQANHFRSNSFKAAPVKILFIPSYYQIPFTRLSDIFMYLSLHVRGAEIISVSHKDFYRSEHPIWSGNYSDMKKKNIKQFDYTTERIWRNILECRMFTLKDKRMSDDIKESEKYVKDITFQNYREKIYRKYPVGIEAEKVVANVNDVSFITDNDETMRQLTCHIQNIIELINAYERLIGSVKPNVIFSNHPFYYMWGAAFSVARRFKIPFYSVGMGERLNTRYFISDSNKMYDFHPGWKSFKCKPMTKKENNMINFAIKERKKGGGFSLPHYKKLNKNGNSLNDLKQWIDPTKPQIFFPVNVPSDASVLGNKSIFNSLYAMIIKMLDYFQKHQELQLIIKAHPAEEQHYNGPPGMDRYCLRRIMNKRFTELPENIYFIDYDSPISTFDIYPFVDLGIMYTSSAAMEMAWIGKPSITSAESFYSGIGYSYEPKSEEEFYALLNKIINHKEPKKLIESRIEISRRFFYYYYFHGCIDFKLFEGNDLGNVPSKFVFAKIDDIMPGQNNALDYICDSILNKKSIFGRNRWPPNTYTIL